MKTYLFSSAYSSARDDDDFATLFYLDHFRAAVGRARVVYVSSRAAGHSRVHHQVLVHAEHVNTAILRREMEEDVDGDKIEFHTVSPV